MDDLTDKQGDNLSYGNYSQTHPTSLSMLTLLSIPAAQDPWSRSRARCRTNPRYSCATSVTRHLCNYSLLTCHYKWLRHLLASPSGNPVCSSTTKKPSLNIVQAIRVYQGAFREWEVEFGMQRIFSPSAKGSSAMGKKMAERGLRVGGNGYALERTDWGQCKHGTQLRWDFPSGRAGDMYEGNEKVLGKERVTVSATSQMAAKLGLIPEAKWDITIPKH